MTAGAAPLTEPIPPPMTDDELAALTELALAADPDTVAAPDAVCLWELAGWHAGELLPTWYMPAPMQGRSSPGWQRWLIAVIVASFLVIDAYGLCSTYGTVAFG